MSEWMQGFLSGAMLIWFGGNGAIMLFWIVCDYIYPDQAAENAARYWPPKPQPQQAPRSPQPRKNP